MENSPSSLIPFTSSSPEETEAFGRSLAQTLRPGDCLALKGPLGAGKTCLSKALAAALGVKEIVRSPTYTIVSEYLGFFHGEEVPVRHIDAYRLSGDEEFAALGGEELLNGPGIAIIEWADRIPLSIPPGSFWLEIAINGDDSRTLSLERR
ncbi:MAG: tRNA (adenosine(37)-N6)-threonylcarbamoyltransferase complex ATPase subunit type 1 TsaE [Treponema sp.]|nr:tRNA (adenosine(37)-N6)-threonylcarbamoyltransferase complex ATPase subunit type 1 TsaE [Treponema sp.]